MNKKYGILIIQILTILSMILITACSSAYVYVQQSNYDPEFNASGYPEYKGKSVYLQSFTNSANDTTTWYYYSPEKKVKYEGSPSLASYFWYCFKRAFRHIGVIVQEPEGQGFLGLQTKAAPGRMNDFRLNFTSLTDSRFVFYVDLLKGGEIIFQKSYRITMPPAESDSPSYLETRAYKMVDMAFTAIVSDSDFKKAFLQ